MSHLMTCGDAPNCTWKELAKSTLAGVNCAKHSEEPSWGTYVVRNLSNCNYRGPEEEGHA